MINKYLYNKNFNILDYLIKFLKKIFLITFLCDLIKMRIRDVLGQIPIFIPKFILDT